MVRRAAECGVEGAVLLDHDWWATDEALGVAAEAAPSMAFWRGCEATVVDAGRGAKDHVVLAADPDVDLIEAGGGFASSDAARLAAFAGQPGVFSMLAHPFRRRFDLAFDLHEFRPVGIDGLSRTANPFRLGEVVRLAGAFGMRVLTASDSHGERDVGRHWVDLEMGGLTVAHLRAAVEAGRYSLHVG